MRSEGRRRRHVDGRNWFSKMILLFFFGCGLCVCSEISTRPAAPFLNGVTQVNHTHVRVFILCSSLLSNGNPIHALETRLRNVLGQDHRVQTSIQSSMCASATFTVDIEIPSSFADRRVELEYVYLLS